MLRVRIAVDGAVAPVEVVNDPGFAFGRDARGCALRKRWQARRDGLDRATASTRLRAVRFHR
jgi:hypothetical protein